MSIFPRTPRLPPELVLHIIDALHDDHPTLSSCSLVSKSWVHQSRRYLLHDIRICVSPGSYSEKTALDTLVSNIEEPVTIPGIGRPFFNYIHKLAIGNFKFGLGWETGPRMASLEIVPLMDVLHRLPHLKELSFKSTRFVTSELIPTLPPPALSLETLILSDTFWDGLDENGCDVTADLAFWSLFKSIDSLSFNPTVCDEPAHTASQTIKQAVFPYDRRNIIRVPEFIISNECKTLEPGIRTLQQVIDFASVTELTITSIVEPEQAPAVVEFIDKCSNVKYIDAPLFTPDLHSFGKNQLLVVW